MTGSDFRIDTADGLRLTGSVRRPSGRPSGLIALVHGMGEHSGRYDHLRRRTTRRWTTSLARSASGGGA